MKEKELVLKEIVKTQLLSHGFNVDFETFDVNEKGIKFTTKDFQTQPILFKKLSIYSNPSSFIENDVKYYCNSVRATHENFSGGYNGFELFTIIIKEFGNRILFEKCI